MDNAFRFTLNVLRTIGAVGLLQINAWAADPSVAMPAQGICAHRGASDTHPENTLAALYEAIRLGAQMIEIDVRLTKDFELILMHDETVDRTTDGRGRVSDLTWAQLKTLDAGSWKSDSFKGEPIPTLDEALEILPENVWLNVHLKGGANLAERVARKIVVHRRMHQAFLACSTKASRAAKGINPSIKICNMERQSNTLQYINETIEQQAAFIQLLGGDVDRSHVQLLNEHGIRINYCCVNDVDRAEALLHTGVEFPLVDRVGELLKAADRLGIERLKPIYRTATAIGQSRDSKPANPSREAPDVVGAEAHQSASEITHGPFVGHATAQSVLVWARCSKASEYALSAQAQDGSPPIETTALPTPSSNGCIIWKLDRLRPGTRYYYQIERGGQILIQGDDYFFETMDPTKPEVVRLAFASCAKEDASSSAVWHRMAVTDPHAVVLLGDTPYIDTTELSVQRRRYAEFAAVPAFRRLFRNRSLYATWDDHDFGRNDTDGNVDGKANSRQAFIEFHAHESYGDGSEGIYTKFSRPGVEVFILDTRTFAATESSPFNEERPSLLGKAQWQWLRGELKASTADFKILACGMIWNGAVRPNKPDHWATYPHERQALFDFIGRERITGVVLVGGDIHRTRVLHHQTTDSAGYKIPELITSPVHDDIIEAANAPHPALVHDSGEPRTFLFITTDAGKQPATLNTSFLTADGRQLFGETFSTEDLSLHNTP